MDSTVEPLVADLLEWIGDARPYAEVMEAWRTSCPRLPVWEEATTRGLVNCGRNGEGTELVFLTDRGREHLRRLRSAAPRY